MPRSGLPLRRAGCRSARLEADLTHTIAQIAEALGAVAHGDLSIAVTGAAEPSSASATQLALAMSPAFAEGLSQGAARAAVVWQGADWHAMGLEAAIEAPRARLALSRLTGLLAARDVVEPGIHPSAVIDASAQIGDDVWVGPLSYIGPRARIGAGSRIAAQVTISADVELGSGALIHPGVRILPRVRIGQRVVMQAGAVIGSDGFSFTTEGVSNPERAKATGGAETLTPPEDGTWHKIESLGAVVIGDDVEIGANSTIDAGTIRPTRIGRGTKLDNMVHVGHNCEIGEDCLLCGQAGLAGSVEVGDRVVLGGQVGVADHHRIGSDVVAGGASAIMNNVPAGRVVLGYPAQRMDQTLNGYKTLRRLSRKQVSKDAPRD